MFQDPKYFKDVISINGATMALKIVNISKLMLKTLRS